MNSIPLYSLMPKGVDFENNAVATYLLMKKLIKKVKEISVSEKEESYQESILYRLEYGPKKYLEHVENVFKKNENLEFDNIKVLYYAISKEISKENRNEKNS